MMNMSKVVLHYMTRTGQIQQNQRLITHKTRLETVCDRKAQKHEGGPREKTKVKQQTYK